MSSFVWWSSRYDGKIYVKDSTGWYTSVDIEDNIAKKIQAIKKQVFFCLHLLISN